MNETDNLPDPAQTGGIPPAQTGAGKEPTKRTRKPRDPGAAKPARKTKGKKTGKPRDPKHTANAAANWYYQIGVLVDDKDTESGYIFNEPQQLPVELKSWQSVRKYVANVLVPQNPKQFENVRVRTLEFRDEFPVRTAMVPQVQVGF